MLIAYNSMTGNVRKFVEKLPLPSIEIKDGLILDEEFILVTYTIGFGLVPKEVEAFLENNYKYLLGIASSGNRNWGTNFAISADKISIKYNVPVLLKFELAGSKLDIEKFMEGLKKLEVYRIKQ